MKALSLHQPWLTLMVIGAKGIETRSWKNDYRGPLALHATKNTDHLELALKEPFKSELAKWGFMTPESLPLGAVCAIVDLVDVFEMTPARVLAMQDIASGNAPKHLVDEARRELAFGAWEVGRFAWKVQNVRRLEKPIPARGFQMLWEWDWPKSEVVAKPQKELFKS